MSKYADRFPAIVEVGGEIPRGGRTKYEFDKAAGVFRLERVLASAVHNNFDCGFIEGTRAHHGDHSDALLLIDEPTFPGCHVWASPIGVLEIRDEKGAGFKILGVCVDDLHQAKVEYSEQVRPHRLVEIEHFFDTCKALEDKPVEVLRWKDRTRAREVRQADRRIYEAEVAGRRTPA